MQGMRMKSHKAVFITSRPQKQSFQGSHYGVSYGSNNVIPFRRPGTSTNNPVVAEAKTMKTQARQGQRPAKTGAKTTRPSKKRTGRR